MAMSRGIDRTTRLLCGTTVALLLACGTGTGQRIQAQAPNAASAEKDATARAEQALRAQDLPETMKQYHARVAADPENSEAWTGLGVLLYGSGRAAEAAEALATALQLNPEAPRAELFLAFSQADLRQCDKAIPLLDKYFASEPLGKLRRLTGLTLLSCSAGGKDKMLALRTSYQLRQMYPGDADVLFESAELYTRLWSETANELMTAHPDSYRVHQLAAEVNEAQGNAGQAIRQYRAALAENSKLPQMHYRIGQLLLKSGDADADAKAMEEFRAELAVNPQSVMSALAMGEIERHNGSLNEAAASYTLATRLEPDLPEPRVGLAQTLLAQHQVAVAQDQLQTVIGNHPENAQAHYAMMLTFREQGKLPEAAAEMKTFQTLQQRGAEQFRDKLNALLTGNAPASLPDSGGAGAPPGARSAR